MYALIVLEVLSGVFRARKLRSQVTKQPASAGKQTPGRITYDLRRLRVRGLIERIPGPTSYRITDLDLSTALAYVHAYDRVVAPGYADTLTNLGATTSIRTAMNNLRKAWAQQADRTAA